MSTITLLSPAKINLTLEILGTRPDGYHELRSLIQPVDFFDEVRISAEEGEGIAIETSGIPIPEDSDNLAWKAADLYLRKSGLALRVDIFIKKRIPPGAGLGGGSGNAASVLVGLNKLWSAFTEETLLKIASAIGADVPFFIRSQSALVEGIGDRITVLRDFPSFYFVVLCPNLHVSTQDVYKKWDELNPARKMGDANNSAGDIQNTVSMFRDASQAPPLKNDLEAPALGLYPEINSYKKMLTSMGDLSVMMTGSGSAVYAIFKNEDQAKEIYDYLKTSPTFQVILAKGVKGWHFLI
jgi:4-diphosphocytidyl-2-C-methyl-D-erythritol kinase